MARCNEPETTLPLDSTTYATPPLSLGLQENTLPAFEAGELQTIEAAGSRVVGIPRHDAGHHLLGTAASREEAVVIATSLRLFNPN